MKRKMITTISVLAGFLLALILFIVFFNKAILRYNFPGWSKGVVQLVNRPKDFYDPLASEALDILDGHAEKNVTINNKYMGLHVVGLLFPKSVIPYVEYHTLHLQADIKCYVENELRYSRSISSGGYFRGKTGSGFHLANYKVPKDLPLDERISCEFSVSDLDMEFVEKYGPVKFFIRKLSDL